jgi:hypothetical protein
MSLSNHVEPRTNRPEKNKKGDFFWLPLKDGIPARNYGISAGIFFIICKIFRHGIFNQKLKSSSDREFYSLYDVLRQFTKFRFLVSSEFEFCKFMYIMVLENKILYQMHFLIFDKKFRGGIFCRL